MTKQNTHSEQSDADISVVEHSSASETNASSLVSNEEAAVFPPTGTESSPEGLPEQQMSQKEEQKLASAEVNQNQDVQEDFAARPVGEPPFTGTASEGGVEPEISMPDATGESATGSSPVEAAPLSPIVAEEEVRPFTDFIEEFRQAEARFNSSLQTYQAESLSLLTSSTEEGTVVLAVTRRGARFDASPGASGRARNSASR